MALGVLCLWRNKRADGNQRREPKTVHIFLGFFFLVNYSLGTGFLAHPYSFLYAGYLAAIPTMVVIVLVTWIHASWILETMARAQAVKSLFKVQKSLGKLSDTDKEVNSELSPPLPLKVYCGSLINIHELHKAFPITLHQPNFEICRFHRYELSELCEIFFNGWAKYLYLLFLSVGSVFFAWSFAVVAATAWATHIPINFGPFQQCSFDAFHNHIIPEEGGCRLTYYFCLMLFGLIVIPLSLLALKEQAIIQTTLGLMRVLLIVLVLVYCIVKLTQGDNLYELQETLISNNTSNRSNSSEPCSFVSNCTTGRILSLQDIVVRFDWRGWLVAIPVFTPSFMIHHTIPSFTHPIKQKQYLWWYVFCAWGFLGFCFLCLGVTVPLWFRGEVQETLTLNWVRLAEPCNSIHLRILSYYIILFPSVQVCSNYPLNNHPLANNIYSTFFEHDTCRKQLRCDRLLKVFIRLFTAIIPILAAFGVSNLVEILKYTGLSGFVLSFIFPALLQLQSIRVCKRTFRGIFTANSVTVADSCEYKDSDGSANAGEAHSFQNTKARNESSLYMTPYSSRILSHPIAVSIIGATGIVLFLMSIASLFIKPDTLGCSG